MRYQPVNPQRYETSEPPAAQPSYGQTPQHPQPAQYPQQYPQSAQYPQPAQYPQYPSYPQSSHPQSSYPQSSHPQQPGAHLPTLAYPVHPQPAAPRAAAGPVKRPRALVLAVTVGLGAIALTTASQVLALLGGREALASTVTDAVPAAGDQVFASIVQSAVDQAYRTIQARAGMSIGLAVFAALLLLLCLRAGLAARLLSVGAMALSGLLLVICLVDVFPGGARLAGWTALVLYPVAAAMLFLPAVARYRAARRAG